jgi:hypothetical protein
VNYAFGFINFFLEIGKSAYLCALAASGRQRDKNEVYTEKKLLTEEKFSCLRQRFANLCI